MFVNVLPRYPEIKAAFDLSNATFGLLVAMLPLGAILASWLPAPLIRRFGALPVGLATTGLTATAMATVGLAAHVVVIGVALLTAGFADAVTDSAQNVHGLRVEDYAGRSIINSLHAMWSLGAVSGGAMGAWAASQQIPLAVHLGTAGVTGMALACIGAALSRLPASAGQPAADQTPAPAPRLTRAMWLTLISLGLLATFGVAPEEVAFDWAALYLGSTVGTSAGVAGLGLVVLVSAQTIGRLLGDPATDRWGAASVLRAGGVLIVLGGLLVITTPTLPLVLIGFALAGFGCATAVPAVYAAAGRLPGLPEGAGIAITSWLLRLGFLALPPLVGLVSDATSLRVALGVLSVSGVVVTVLASRVGSGQRG